MSLCFDLPIGAALTGDGRNEPARRRVLVTGAAGNIGSHFAERSHGKYVLRLTDRAFGEKRESMTR